MFWFPFLAIAAALEHLASALNTTRCPLPELCFSLEIPDETLIAGTGDIFIGISGPQDYGGIYLKHRQCGVGVELFQLWTDGLYSSKAVYAMATQETDDARAYGIGYPEYIIQRDGKIATKIKCTTCDTNSGSYMDLTRSISSRTWEYEIRDWPISGTFKFGDPPSDSSQPKSLLLQQSGSRVDLGVRSLTSRGPPPHVVHMAIAHGFFACLAWTFIFPLGGILIRLCSFPKLLWVHALLQIFGLCLYTVAVGLGIEAGISPRHWWIKNKHAIIGLIVYGLFLLQSSSGYIHHLMFKKYISRTSWSYLHLWTGRLCITLGMINAGFGFQLREQGYSSWKVVLYTVCAVLVWVAYVTSAVVGEWRRKHRNKREALVGEEEGSSRGRSGAVTPVSSEVAKVG